VTVLVVLTAAYLYFSRQETPLEPIDKQEQAVTLPSSAAPDKSVTFVGAPLQSVAVLPFADMSPGKDQEYFADGVAEEVLNQLSQIRDLFVVGRTSSFSFKGRNEDLRVIGEKLGVSHLLEGSVRKDSNQVRVSAQLIKAADGYHLWSQTYDRTLEDIFTIQEDISTAVAQALQVSLGLGEFGRPGWTRNAAAYEEYLQGRSHYLKASPQSLLKAVEHYQRAIEIDPAFILARTSLVETFC
jgi:TolB-like protein